MRVSGRFSGARLHEVDGVHVEDEVAAGDGGGFGEGEEGLEGVGEGAAAVGFEDEVEAVDALEFGDGGGGGAEDADAEGFGRARSGGRWLVAQAAASSIFSLWMRTLARTAKGG